MNISWQTCKDALATAYVERPRWYKELAGIMRTWFEQGLIELPLGNTSWVDNRINERAALLARIQDIQEDGVIAIVRSGIDCDGSQYTRTIHCTMPHMMKFQMLEDQHYDSLDGVESTHFGRPSEYPREYKSRDLAMEAYENGHPSLLIPGAL